MATWNVSDELDARVRQRIGAADVNRYVEEVIANQLDCEDDPQLQRELLERTKRGMADADGGRVRPAREVMDELAEKHGLSRPK